jgi:hypothetical protein
MKILKIFLIFLSLLSVSTLAQTETGQQVEERQKREEQERARQIREKMDRQAQESTRPPEIRTIYRNPVDKEEVQSKTEALTELNAQFAISDEYRNKYSVFLNQKNTGIVRMFPDKNCDRGLTVTIEELERCSKIPQIKGNGSRYSIKFNSIPSYFPFQGILNLFKESDIHYIGNSLLFGNENTQSLVTEIGDVNLEEINLKSPAGKFLTDFKPSRSTTEFQQQTKILEKGVTNNDFLYSTFAPVKLNSVYVFRSIAFSPIPKISPVLFWNKDLFVVFKIVGQENDGSIIFIWKKLKEKSAPYLENR